MRLFVAVAIPETIRWQLSLLAEGLPGVSWVPPDNFHLTLRFIGEVDGGEMADLDAALAGIRAPQFSLRLSGVGHFGAGKPERGGVRAIWVGVEREPGLLHLRDKVESAVVRAGQPPERQKYTPHVTLARPKSTPTHKLQEFLAQHSRFRSEPFEVTQFELYQSFLKREGAVYRIERSYELSLY